MQLRSDAIARIEVSTGDGGWPQAAPLLGAVWPSEVVATLPWRDVVWAHADHRVLVFDSDSSIVGHVGLFIRIAQWNARNVKIGGIGGVATREDSRRKGIASLAMQHAVDELREVYTADFGLLFCEPCHAPLYQKLGWRAFEGNVFVAQPAGRIHFTVTDPYVFDLKMAPRRGTLDLCGLPW
jgi:aminoglycoside 2'-N-acetyltransferase I